MKKISKSIDRLKAKAKLLGMNHLSAPTENRDYSIGLKALDPLDKFDIPTTPKISVLNKIQNVNENFKDAFKYSDKDIEMLSQHPLILRKVSNWGENLTSDYLLDLKKKERQIEYWKHRVKYDFKPAIDLIQKHKKEKEIELMKHKMQVNKINFTKL